MFSTRGAVELDIPKLTWSVFAILLGKKRALPDSVHYEHGHGKRGELDCVTSQFHRTPIPWQSKLEDDVRSKAGEGGSSLGFGWKTIRCTLHVH